MNRTVKLLSLILLLPAGCRSPQTEPPRVTHDPTTGITTVAWQPFASPKRFYKVYRGDEPISPVNLFTTEKVGDRLKPGSARLSFPVNGSGPHYYAVSTCDEAGHTNTLFTQTTSPIVETDCLPPPPPLITGNASYGCPEISWAMPTRQNLDRIAFWRIYRGIGPFRQKSQAEVAGRIGWPGYRSGDTITFTDVAIVTPGYYYYAVTAIDTSGNESNLSAPKKVTVEPKLNCDPLRNIIPAPQLRP